MTFSFVIPTYHAAGHIRETAAMLCSGIARDDRVTEVIFVNDASRDATPELLQELQQKYPKVRMLSLERNCGQHAATLAGVCISRGDVVVTMDDDVRFSDFPFDDVAARLSEDPDKVVYLVNSADLSQHVKYRAISFIIRLISGNPDSPNIGSSQRCFLGRILRERISGQHRYIYLDVLFFYWGMHADHIVTAYTKTSNHLRYSLADRANLLGHALIFYRPGILAALLFTANLLGYLALRFSGLLPQPAQLITLLLANTLIGAYIIRALFRYRKDLPKSIRQNQER